MSVIMERSAILSPVAMMCTDEEEEAASYPSEIYYKIHHFLRNVCSKVLAEFLARELRNASFIKHSDRSREEILSLSLFRLLKNVSSKGKKKAQKMSRCTTEESSSASNTMHLNNLNDNKAALESIQLGQLLMEEKGSEAAVKCLSMFDSAFLLYILTNDILEFPHNMEVREALETLKEIRNSIQHSDNKKSNLSMSEQLHTLCIKTKFLCTYLDRDYSCLQNYIPDTQSSFCQAFREVQQEIHQRLYELPSLKHSHQQHSLHPSIKHLRGYCQTDEIVENLIDFLAKNRVSGHEEPRPVLLCGARGAGKSSVLHGLVLSICEEQLGRRNFPLVVTVDDVERTTRENFWQCLFHRLAGFCPDAVLKYGQEEVVNVLSIYSSRFNFLFLMDQNIQDTRKLNQLMPLMDRGMWVLSYQGVPEPSNFYHVLKMEPVFEEQVLMLLKGITESEEDYKMVSWLYRTCNYKGFVDTPDMVSIFAKACLEIKDCVPFYGLIQHHIYSKIPRTDENERELIKIGRKAMDMIRLNRKYYYESSLDDIDKGVKSLLLECDPLRGSFFKYRVVEDYLAAKYVVQQTKVACELWLSQAPLFKRVFEIVCSLWKQKGDIRTNLPYIREYLEKLFNIVPPKRRQGKERKKESMEIDKTDEEMEDATSQNNFVRWTFLANIAKDHQNNEDILLLLAELLAYKNSWLFKCKSLTEKCLDNLSLVFRHVNLTKELTINLVSGPNVTMLTKLWVMLSSHQGVCSNTSVRLVIHHTNKNWIMHEKLLTLFPTTVAKTTSPLHITKYVGPLLCSGTERFLRCSCMRKLDVLEVDVYDLESLREVLAQREKLGSVIVRVSLRLEEMKIPNTIIKLSSSFPLHLTITYFEGLQMLLDRMEPPHYLSSLRICRVYIHENFSLDLRRFTKLKFLSIRFCHMGKLPSVYLEEPQSEGKMEMDDTKNYKRVFGLPLEQWVLHLALKMHLPLSLERLLLRNLSFCNDSNVLILNRYWSSLPFQRLIFLDTQISMSKFKEILLNLVSDSKIEEVTKSIEKKCRLEELSESQKNIIKQERLARQEREKKRQNKPKGKEVIITSDARLCRQCHLFSCSCVQPSINQCQNTYQDFVTLVNNIYSYKILSINYSSRDITLRKDMCGDLHLQCPLAFLNDELVQNLELVQAYKDCQELQELTQVLLALALAQAITVTHTCLSHEGALSLLQYLKQKKQQFGRVEPFRLTIFSHQYHTCPKSLEEVQHSHFLREVKEDDSLQQFNFRCDCMKRCHYFKKSIKGWIYFNDEILHRN